MRLFTQTKENGRKRVLATVGEKKCPLGCIYCFVENPDYPDFPRIDTPQAQDIIEKTAKEVDVIQPACDVELLLLPNALQILEELSKYGKSISFATKANVNERTAELLAGIHNKLVKVNAILQIAVSLTRLVHWQDVERFTVSPELRIKSLKTLYGYGIPTTVAIKPLLPFVPSNEICDIVSMTQKYCHGYLTGPTYLTPALKEYMHKINYRFEDLIQIRRTPWMIGSPSLETISSPHLERALTLKSSSFNLPVFTDNISATLTLSQKYKL
jgi:DNA repair photolyase